jgi:DNA-binding PadR family transcriptional regulator
MLDMQPMSGYDIQQALKMTNAERWGGVLLGSIYHALKKMEQEGHVAVNSIEQTGHRQKAIYTITEKGKQHLKDLVRDSLTESSVIYPSTMYSGLSFYDKLDKDSAQLALEAQRRRLDEEYTAVVQGIEAKSKAMKNHIPPMVSLILDHMLTVVRQQQDFVEKALEILNKEQ